MSNYNVTRFFRSTRHSLNGGSISFFRKGLSTAIWSTGRLRKYSSKETLASSCRSVFEIGMRHPYKFMKLFSEFVSFITV